MSPTEHLYHELLIRGGYRHFELLERDWDLARRMIHNPEWLSMQRLHSDSYHALQTAAMEESP